MFKAFIKRTLPDDKFFKRHKRLRWFGRLLQDANLWHLNRHCVAKAFGIGLFCAFMPMPFQMAMACAAAIILSANLPLSVALVWVSNPITIAPIFYGSYKVGSWLLASPKWQIQEYTLNALYSSLNDLWLPMMCGTLILGLVFGIAGYCVSQFCWRVAVIRKWRRRSQRMSSNHLERDLTFDE